MAGGALAAAGGGVAGAAGTVAGRGGLGWLEHGGHGNVVQADRAAQHDEDWVQRGAVVAAREAMGFLGRGSTGVVMQRPHRVAS